MAAYDIREIRLIKSHENMTILQLLDQAKQEAENHPETKPENWLCLGHFDLLQIRAVPCGKEKSPLSCIRDAMKSTLDETHSLESFG